jgi:hypothetical protein
MENENKNDLNQQSQTTVSGSSGSNVETPQNPPKDGESKDIVGNQTQETPTSVDSNQPNSEDKKTQSAKPEAKPQQPTPINPDDEIEKLVKSMLERFGYDENPQKTNDGIKPQKKEQEPSEPIKEQKPAAPKTQQRQSGEQAKQAKPVRKITSAQIDRLRNEIIKEPAPVQPQPSPIPTQSQTQTPTANIDEYTPEVFDPDEFKEKLQLFKTLEELYPRKYKGITEELINFDRATREYIEKWQEENPDEPFDPADDAHAEFFSKYYPEVDDDDRVKALYHLETRRISEQQQQHEKVSKVVNKLKDDLSKEQKAFVPQFIGSIDQDAVKVFEKDGFKGLEEKYPDIALALNSAAANATPYLAAAVALTTPDLPQDVLQNIPPQVMQDVLGWIRDLDLKIKSLPPSQQVYNGKIYVPLDQINNVDPKYADRIWTLASNPGWIRECVQKIAASNIANQFKPYVDRVRTIYRQSEGSGYNNNPPTTSSTTDRSIPIPSNSQKQEDIADIILKKLFG